MKFLDWKKSKKKKIELGGSVTKARFQNMPGESKFAPNQNKRWTAEQVSHATNPQISVEEASLKTGKTKEAIQIKRSKLRYNPPKKGKNKQ